MKFCYAVENDPEIYARSLQLGENQKFQWQSTGGWDILLVQTPYGMHPTDSDNPFSMDKLCALLNENNTELKTGEFVSVTRDIWVMYLTKQEILQQKALIRTEASTYTVFCCRQENDCIRVQAHHNINWTTAPYVDIPLNFEYAVQPVFQTRRVLLFGKREEFSGYYKLILPQKLHENYEDGSIRCQLQCGQNQYTLPITRRMLKQGEVFLMTGEESIVPEIVAGNNGFKLKKRN